MHSSLTLLPAVVSLVSASTYPDTVPLSRRQEPGTPEYDCHAACGGLLPIARMDNFCENPDFASGLETCLGCAEETDVWQYYSDGVTAAAEQCGLDATPAPASGDSDSGNDDAGASESSGAPLEVMPSVTDDGSAPMETMPSMTDAPAGSSTGGAEMSPTASDSEEEPSPTGGETAAAESSPTPDAASAQDSPALFSVFGALLAILGLM